MKRLRFATWKPRRWWRTKNKIWHRSRGKWKSTSTPWPLPATRTLKTQRQILTMMPELRLAANYGLIWLRKTTSEWILEIRRPHGFSCLQVGAMNFGITVGSSQKLHWSIIGTSREPLRPLNVDKYVGEFVGGSCCSQHFYGLLFSRAGWTNRPSLRTATIADWFRSSHWICDVQEMPRKTTTTTTKKTITTTLTTTANIIDHIIDCRDAEENILAAN